MEKSTFRLVTARDDEFAQSCDDYDVVEARPVVLKPSGEPEDETLEGSLPPPGLDEVRFVDPVTLIVTATLATLVLRVVRHWLKSKEAGVQIDLRTMPPTISRLAGVPAGMLVIIRADGGSEVHQGVYEEPDQVLTQLTQLVSSADQ